MAIHESSVNFQNLIQDLAEMYPIDISEVVVVELIANSLDAKATRISISYDSQNKVLVVQDNGEGMKETQFEEYHDFAAALKPRGAGIGFAGLGAKISFNLAGRVITETYGKSLSKGSNWYLQSKKKLVWEDMEPQNIQEKGTRVEVHFRPDKKLSFKSSGDIVRLLYRHYLPLLDIKFLNLYERMKIYSNNLRFVVNTQVINPIHLKEQFSLNNIKEFFPARGGKKFGYGILGLAESEYPVSPDLCGVVICTYGKIIKGDLFNQFPGKLGPNLFGLVEIPEFVKFLTTSKTDFVRKGKHRLFERLYGPIRREFKDWLNSIGVETSEVFGSDEAIEIERELKKIIEEIPELSDFFGFRMRKDILQKNEKGVIASISQEGADITFPYGEGEKGRESGIFDEGDGPSHAIVENKESKDRASPISRKGRRGPKVTFNNRPDRTDLAWVEGNNVVINSGHPSYIKARSNQKTRKLHNLFALASAIQRFLGSEGERPDLLFVDRMMAAWGRK
jgi:hypothetical protein